MEPIISEKIGRALATELDCWERDVAAALRAIQLAAESDFSGLVGELGEALRSTYGLLLAALLIAPEGEPRQRVTNLVRRVEAGLATGRRVNTVGAAQGSSRESASQSADPPHRALAVVALYKRHG